MSTDVTTDIKPRACRLLNFQTVEFLTSAATLVQCPKEIVREIAFVGRSNAGKSSVLNALTGSKKLAKISKKPGCTQLINFFMLQHHDYALVDLPGYGYARVSQTVKKNWESRLSEYLYERKSLVGLVLVMDIRHPLKPFDQAMLDWSLRTSIPMHIILTKSDKMKRGAAHKALYQTQKMVKEMTDTVSIQLFSSTHKVGVLDLQQKLSEWFLQYIA